MLPWKVAGKMMFSGSVAMDIFYVIFFGGRGQYQ